MSNLPTAPRNLLIEFVESKDTLRAGDRNGTSYLPIVFRQRQKPSEFTVVSWSNFGIGYDLKSEACDFLRGLAHPKYAREASVSKTGGRLIIHNSEAEGMKIPIGFLLSDPEAWSHHDTHAEPPSVTVTINGQSHQSPESILKMYEAVAVEDPEVSRILVNRALNSLAKKGLITISDDSDDAIVTLVHPAPVEVRL